VEIRPADPTSADARALLALSDAFAAGLYPPESYSLESAESLTLPDSHFLGCFQGPKLVGCGAVKVYADDGVYGEMKRIYVLEGYRRRGISRALIAALEAHLLSRGIHIARLETGIEQPEAIGMYEGLGYVQRPKFGGYAGHPLSVFMEKRLS